MVGVAGVGQEVWVAWGTEVPHNVLESMTSLSTSGNWAQTGLAPAGVLGALPQVGEEGHRCRYMFLYSKKQYGCNGEFSIFLFLSYKAHEKCSFFFLSNPKCEDSTKTGFYSILQKYTAVSHSGVIG